MMILYDDDGDDDDDEIRKIMIKFIIIRIAHFVVSFYLCVSFPFLFFYFFQSIPILILYCTHETAGKNNEMRLFLLQDISRVIILNPKH